MKKLIALLMSSALLLSLAACSGDKTDTDVNTETTAAAVNDETVATEERRILTMLLPMRIVEIRVS